MRTFLPDLGKVSVRKHLVVGCDNIVSNGLRGRGCLRKDDSRSRQARAETKRNSSQLQRRRKNGKRKLTKSYNLPVLLLVVLASEDDVLLEGSVLDPRGLTTASRGSELISRLGCTRPKEK
jgi:hypothetical protein